jgi:hypothetical protein
VFTLLVFAGAGTVAGSTGDSLVPCSLRPDGLVRKTPLFSPFVVLYKMHHFTKTGSGQTQGKHSKKSGVFRRDSCRNVNPIGQSEKYGSVVRANLCLVLCRCWSILLVSYGWICSVFGVRWMSRESDLSPDIYVSMYLCCCLYINVSTRCTARHGSTTTTRPRSGQAAR